jgi:pimeloyl-CoA dehydrogenase
MTVMLECSDSMAMLAALTLSDPEGCDRGDLAAAKVVVGRYGRGLCEQAIQLHGGIGMTEEYGVGRYLQRLLVIDQLFGSSDDRIGHLNQLHRGNAHPSPAQA